MTIISSRDPPVLNGTCEKPHLAGVRIIRGEVYWYERLIEVEDNAPSKRLQGALLSGTASMEPTAPACLLS